jgi:AraC family transcriptional regulator, positive regulator of tynA and feaB
MGRGQQVWTIAGDVAAVPDRWGEMLSATHLPWRVSVPRGPEAAGFAASAKRWWIDDLALVDCECGVCSGTRTRQELGQTDGEFIVVLIILAGCESVAQGPAEGVIKTGDALAWDSTKPARFTVEEPVAKRSLLIPLPALEEVGSRAWQAGGVLLDGAKPATRLFTSYLDTLATMLDRLDQSAVNAARNATLELFIGALRTGGEVPVTAVTQPALRAQMDRYIERHLLNAAVSPADIAAAHAVSVRTVNRIFSATGETVSEVIRVRRLARARQDVTSGERSISSIAHAWGFADTSHFSRSFKAHYGMSPSEYRQACLDGTGERGARVQRPVARILRDRDGADETGVTAAQS